METQPTTQQRIESCWRSTTDQLHQIDADQVNHCWQTTSERLRQIDAQSVVRTCWHGTLTRLQQQQQQQQQPPQNHPIDWDNLPSNVVSCLHVTARNLHQVVTKRRDTQGRSNAPIQALLTAIVFCTAVCFYATVSLSQWTTQHDPLDLESRSVLPDGLGRINQDAERSLRTAARLTDQADDSASSFAVFLDWYVPTEFADADQKQEALENIRQQLEWISRSETAVRSSKGLTIWYHTIGSSSYTSEIQALCAKQPKLTCTHVQHLDRADSTATLQNVYDYCQAPSISRRITYLHNKDTMVDEERERKVPDSWRKQATWAALSQNCTNPTPEGESCNVCSLFTILRPFLHVP